MEGFAVASGGTTVRCVASSSPPQTPRVPPQVDALQLLAVPGFALLSELWFDAVREHLQRLPGRLNRRLTLAVRAAENERVGPQNRRPTMRFVALKTTDQRRSSST